MKTLYYIIALILLFFNLGFSQESKNYDITERRDLKNFTTISSNLNADIYLTQADSFSFEVSGRSKLIKLLETEVTSEGVLKIRLDRSSDVWDNVDKVSIYISAPSFEKLKLSGAGKVRAKTALKSSKMGIYISGANTLEFKDVHLDELNLELSGVGNIEISGEATKANIELSGTGNIDVMDLVIQDAHCDISGLGRLSCDVKMILMHPYQAWVVFDIKLSLKI